VFVVGVAGPSESGKSHGTEYLQTAHETIRLKLVKVLASIYKDQVDPSMAGFDGWPFRVEHDEPDWLIDRLRDWFDSNVRPASIVTIESLYGPRMCEILQSASKGQYALCYIDAPYDLRVRRQGKTASLRTVDEARRLLGERDKAKEGAGLSALRDAADFVINNGSTIQSFHDQLDRCLDSVGGIKVAP
jgi:hypothetical protein